MRFTGEALMDFIRLFRVLIIVGFFLPSLAIAQDVVLPAQVFTAVMLKALSYDRNIDRQGKDKVIIGIVSPSNNAAAQAFAVEVRGNIGKVQSIFYLKDKPVDSDVLVLEDHFDKAKFEDRLKKR
jgi:hypothetical protein